MGLTAFFIVFSLVSPNPRWFGNLYAKKLLWVYISTCNVGDPSSIPGSERSPGEEIGYTLQYSWASLVPQLVKNLPAMRETCVPSLGLEDPLEKGKATHSRIPWTVHGVSKSWTWLSDSHFHTRRISAALSRGLRWYAYMALL